MPAFQPIAGTRAQIDARPVVNGQFLVATDTGEAFVDIGGLRIPISGGGGDGGDDEDDGLATVFQTAGFAICMSGSVSGGGPGSGVVNAPLMSLEPVEDVLATLYSTVQEEEES